jgi:hypothetical protein
MPMNMSGAFYLLTMHAYDIESVYTFSQKKILARSAHMQAS